MEISRASRRVVITGIGLVSPLGVGTEKNWASLLAGRSGIGRISRFDTKGYTTTIAGEIDGFDPLQYIDVKESKKMDPFIQYAVVASQLAVDDSGIDQAELAGERTGVLVGSGIGGIGSIEKTHVLLLERGPSRISPFFLISAIINEASGQISIRFRSQGPNLATATACSTSSHAVGDSFRIIARGEADRMITGGAEAPITPLGVAGFCAMRALSTNNREPQKASRPFDLDRDGFVMAEGAGILLLEELETARKRGAKIYAEIAGYGMSGDAYHVSAPQLDGQGAAQSMHHALADAGVKPEAVGYINAHGTSTPYNDKIETLAIKIVFRDHASKIMVNSTKSMTGHLLGAAGGLEAGISALVLKNQISPPTINYETPDPECDLDYVPNTARRVMVEYALTNSFGFGGTNATILLRRYKEGPD